MTRTFDDFDGGILSYADLKILSCRPYLDIQVCQISYVFKTIQVCTFASTTDESWVYFGVKFCLVDRHFASREVSKSRISHMLLSFPAMPIIS